MRTHAADHRVGQSEVPIGQRASHSVVNDTRSASRPFLNRGKPILFAVALCQHASAASSSTRRPRLRSRRRRPLSSICHHTVPVSALTHLVHRVPAFPQYSKRRLRRLGAGRAPRLISAFSCATVQLGLAAGVPKCRANACACSAVEEPNALIHQPLGSPNAASQAAS